MIYHKKTWERLTSALYLRLKKRKVLNIVKGETFWAFRNFNLLQSIKNFEGWTNFEKKLHSAEIDFKGGTLLSRPVLYLTLKME